MWKVKTRFVFGERLEAHLPERVYASIATRQMQSEILIGWVQLVRVVIFGTLYAVAPKTGRNADFRPVPWSLAL